MKYNLPPLSSLPAFEAAARKKSFTKASEELCVTQAAISFQVRNLEKSLGVELFERRHRTLELTRAGEDLYRTVQVAFSKLAAEKAAITGRKPKHSFSISVPVSFCSKWLVPRLHRLYEAVPGVTLLIDANDSVAELDDGSVDLAIRYAKSVPKSVKGQLMIEDTVFPVSSPGVAQPLQGKQDFDDIETLVLLHDQMLDVTWADWMRDAGVAKNPSNQQISFSHTANAVDAAVSGRGFALGRLPLVEHDLNSGRLVQPFTTVCKSSYAYYLLQPHRPRRNKMLEKIVEWLVNESKMTTKALN